ncbi:LysR substrate-binding domain-containing protein [Aquincola sp. J276]|uniref:LysR substrate-binding domain-containing protein n=1 Tax=Aquincola sp. J276 TaxID=2898432 RepID=UPI002150CE1F|nr:LysR substrate-binding domain-containing protein [Aquincola sp. J276]MCR5867450.1 LysR substrate-binding domain-containing protein [Aquincola sp. J276]
MRRKIPSLGALAAFEAAARHQSFTTAADELAVTQSAVCRQIATLEDFVGVKLFRRTRRGVVLTDAGINYSRRVRDRLDDVERDTLEVMARGGPGGSLELGVVPTFATQWLLPRLPDFHRQHPGITLHFAPRTRPFLFDDSTLHAAIYAGPAGWPGTESHFLMQEAMVAVASPALVPGQLKAQDLAGHTLLQASTRPHAWRQWFAAQGVVAPNDMAGPRMELFSMLAKAAVHGLGVALIPRLLIEDDLAAGRLRQVVPFEWISDRSYYLIYPQAPVQRQALQVFSQWLQAQAAPYRAAASAGG